MTRTPFSTRALVAGPAALFLAACAVPGMSGAKVPADAPFDCALRATDRNGGVSIAGTLEARAAFSGRYRLQIGQSGAGNSAMIDQGGEFVVSAGEVLDLGQISLSGPSGLTGQLTVDWSGGTVTCPLTRL